MLLKSFLAYTILTVFFLFWFLFQQQRSLALRERLKLRVVVNGTRGKSSVTRFIAAGLRSDKNFTVLGKTTGTDARWIFADGKEARIKRRGNANIREMAQGLRLAAKLNSNAYVAECMAILPEYQTVIEKHWLHSHIVVITNIRPDHEDELGTGLTAIAKALSSSLPSEGILVTVPSAAVLLKQVSNFPEDRIVIADKSKIKPEWLQLFTVPVIDENLAIALEVCRLAGVPYQQALEEMVRAQDDPGNLEIVKTAKFTFIGAFAANDPVSTKIIADRYPPPADALRGIWIHGRRDRKQRTLLMLELSADLRPDFLIFSGDCKFMKGQQKRFFSPKKGIFCIGQNADGLQKVINSINAENIWLLGVGNTKGIPPQRAEGELLCQRLS